MKIKYLADGEVDPVAHSKCCRVCASADIRPCSVIESYMLSGKRLHLLHCLFCGSYFYDGENPVEGYLSGMPPGGNWKHYVQYGALIMAMLQPLFALGDAAKGDLLDIGCGFGFVPHYWQSLKLGEAVGLEGADYGRKGKEVLKVRIHNSYYEECDELKGKKFDIIYSSEVLEHVAAPVEFLKQARSGLRSGGILILTTPSSSVVDKKGHDCPTMAVLRPHFHYFISSEKGLLAMLAAAGYEYVRILDMGGRLIAWASNEELPGIDPEKVDWKAYFCYLDILSNHQDRNISGGALYRLTRDFYTLRRMGEALRSFSLLEKLSREAYDLSLKHPEIKRYLSRRTPPELLDQDPAWYGAALYYGGMIVGRMAGDPATKLRMMDAANLILEYETGNEVFRRYVQEAEGLSEDVKIALISANIEIVSQTYALSKTRHDCMKVIHARSVSRRMRSLVKKMDFRPMVSHDRQPFPQRDHALANTSSRSIRY